MNSFTQESTLQLKTKVNANNKNIIEKMFFTPPLKILTPLEEDNITTIMLLSVSAGLMKGDNHKIQIEIGKHSKIRLTSQSYEKIHDTQNGHASKHMYITLGENAVLDYTPLPIMPFKNSSFKGHTQIYLEKNSKLYFSEIFCAGRVENGELFDFREFDSKLSIYKNNRLAYFENMLLKPTQVKMQNCCSFDNYTHSLSLIIFDDNIDFSLLKQKVSKANANINIGISKNNESIIIKALAHTSETLLQFRESLELV
ncbi:urease accessory protein UreH [Helicobacter aurati]|uniref:Urease accessory protein UreH n=1 Tax=Helicobacter aurati TaxID=137778 RepID=A0A3D8J5B1_9HELI|nr:urease accessory protein UreD [Helicobacter aurati]RDU72682.1 urease accessory protein UreH [Helicobacter aurati]